MPMGVPTKSKTKTLPKICETHDGIHTNASTVDEVTRVEENFDNTKQLTEIDVDVLNAEVDKIVELTGTLTDDVGVEGANLVVEEVTISLVDEVLDTSIAKTWSWEVAGED